MLAVSEPTTLVAPNHFPASWLTNHPRAEFSGYPTTVFNLFVASYGYHLRIMESLLVSVMNGKPHLGGSHYCHYLCGYWKMMTLTEHSHKCWSMPRPKNSNFSKQVSPHPIQVAIISDILSGKVVCYTLCSS